MIISKINNAQSFKGVYFSKVKQDKLTQGEKAALTLLEGEIRSQRSLDDYDFVFGKINETPEGKDIFVKVDLECSENNYRRLRLPIKGDYETVQASLDSLKRAVHSIKSRNLKEDDDITLEDIY